MDASDESMLLAMRLQLEDVDQVLQYARLGGAGAATDADYLKALRDLKDNLQSTLAQIETERQSDETPNQNLSPEHEHGPEALAAQLGTLDLSKSDNKDEVGSTSTPQSSVECISCGGHFAESKIVKTPCEHSYCPECMRTLFQKAVVDESLFPPRCCKQPIPVKAVLDVLSEELVREFREKEVEYSSTDRTYCHKPSCSAFIKRGTFNFTTATCVKCGNKTCHTCKGEGHLGDCPKDDSTQKLLELAKANGWRRCSSCHRMVELKTGCYHITCLCKAEFCYLCGVKWKGCRCLKWHEWNLLDRATVIVDRDRNFLDHPDPEGERQSRVQAARQRLIRTHECNHTSWTFRHGADTCEECHDNLPTFTFECDRCGLRACRRCKLNRL